MGQLLLKVANYPSLEKNSLSILSKVASCQLLSNFDVCSPLLNMLTIHPLIFMLTGYRSQICQLSSLVYINYTLVSNLSTVYPLVSMLLPIHHSQIYSIMEKKRRYYLNSQFPD